MKVKILLEMDLVTEDGNPLPENRRRNIADDVYHAIQNRLFGQGFLPDDVLVDAWKVEPI